MTFFFVKQAFSFGPLDKMATMIEVDYQFDEDEDPEDEYTECTSIVSEPHERVRC